MIQVLIIEDDPMVAKFNAIYLESISGFSVAGFAKNIEEGREFLRLSHVDLILLDVYMKGPTGLELLMELRKEGDSVDVILITAANDKATVQQALRYGAVDYVIKPFTFERFQNALLQFKKQFHLMNRQEQISQEEIDNLLQTSNRKDRKTFEPPKGLTKITLSRIVKQIIAWEGKTFSATELAEKTGISSVSARKYLHYLVEQKLIDADVIYQETGRPLTNYFLKPEKVDILQSLMTS
ncbi:response regulator [Sporosarcina sp. GW1-11]|uniref:response regulator n=1 Tax=Sporosarcina sp. GW1-11 TaxID=2899126 RepID=UPI00294F2689|nr:response regulator [Sporosarcina sp. GW1-11]MDV6379506.1 response regulator [Sporosarcina sp. GW1-11]